MNENERKLKSKESEEEQFGSDMAEFEAYMSGVKPLEHLETGMHVEGPVLTIGAEVAIVDLGAKSEAYIAVKEFAERDGTISLAVGQVISAYVISVSGGEIVLSRALNQANMPPSMIFDAFHNGIPVQGTVTAKTKGGLAVTVFGRRAFLPASQIELTFVEELDAYIGKSLRCKILEIGEGGRNVILSRSALLREEAAEQAARLLAKLSIGDILQGTVATIMPYGVFVNCGGLDGLVHISELSWSQVTTPDSVVKVGDTVLVKVTDIKIEAGKPTRISLSLRQTQGDPWERFLKEFIEGAFYEGKVVRLAPFGAFVELLPGVDGLVHISEMVWGKRIGNPAEVVSLGDQVMVRILTVDSVSRRVSLSMKDVKGDPWQGASRRFQVGSVINGTVERIAPFGVFVSVVPGVVGLIPNDQLLEQQGRAKDQLVGKPIKAMVLEVDEEQRRMRLSAANALAYEDQTEYREFVQSRGAEPGGSHPKVTLGDLIRKKTNQDS